MNKKLRWDEHNTHYYILKEFYAGNKYNIEEPLKDALLDAIDCFEYIMTEKGKNYKEDFDTHISNTQLSKIKLDTKSLPHYCDILKEFYYSNEEFLTDQFKHVLQSSIKSMEIINDIYVISTVCTKEDKDNG